MMTMVVVAVAHVSAVMFVIVICASLRSDGSTSKGEERKKSAVHLLCDHL